MAQQNLPIHSHERLPHTAPQVLETNPKIHLFFINNQKFKQSS